MTQKPNLKQIKGLYVACKHLSFAQLQLHKYTTKNIKHNKTKMRGQGLIFKRLLQIKLPLSVVCVCVFLFRETSCMFFLTNKT